MKEPEHLRKVANRSGSRPCAVCGVSRILVEHHLRGREIPNANAPSNVCNVCDNCHRDLHEGRIVIEGFFVTTTGRKLFWHCAGETGVTGESVRPYLIPKT